MLLPLQLPDNSTLFIASVYFNTEDPKHRESQLAALHSAVKLLALQPGAPVVITGDWNSILYPIDSANGLPGVPSKATASAADRERKLLAKHHLTDPWRLANPTTVLYSHFHPSQHEPMYVT